MLFLNKNDLFQEKIKTVDMQINHPTYKGGCDYDNALAWVKKQYLSLYERPDLYLHVTDATDTNTMKYVLGACTIIILNSKLSVFY